jgi:AmiR/NasT family two-component response regulator
MPDDEHAVAAAARQERVDQRGGDSAIVRRDIEGLEAQVVVDRGLIEHLQAKCDLSREKIDNLETALVPLAGSVRAMGILMASRKLTAEQAFELLRAKSQATHRKLRDVADDVLLTGRCRRSRALPWRLALAPTSS